MDLAFSPEVAAGGALVALESTLVAHGLPWPANYEVARELEDVVRAAGAVPATIAVVDGVPRIGLSADELRRLAEHGSSFKKAGATDLSVHIARGSSAATTVSGTLLLAAKAGLRVFATGGIGGVHRGDSLDISHDLVALSRSRLAVVSAGAKAILDLPRTLEQLETLGVLVIGYQTDVFPEFYTRGGALKLEHRVDRIEDLAAIARTHWDDLGGAGILVCNPIPASDALDPDLVTRSIDEALRDAESEHVTGKAITPFLLARLAKVTAGASIRANRALALNNARVAAELAIALLR